MSVSVSALGLGRSDPSFLRSSIRLSCFLFFSLEVVYREILIIHDRIIGFLLLAFVASLLLRLLFSRLIVSVLVVVVSVTIAATASVCLHIITPASLLILAITATVATLPAVPIVVSAISPSSLVGTRVWCEVVVDDFDFVVALLLAEGHHILDSLHRALSLCAHLVPQFFKVCVGGLLE